jgi:uncharacterized protein (TIGR03435 family)
MAPKPRSRNRRTVFQRTVSLDPVQNPDLPSAPCLFTALVEQLGLRLESTKGPVEVFIIDYIDRTIIELRSTRAV